MEAKRALVKRYVFGTNHDGENCLHWMDDGSLLYPVGKTVVLQQPHSCHQRFLEAAYQSTAITAIAMSANKKFVAIAESGEHPQIQIIDTVTRKRRKILSVAELDSDHYVALSFSSDGRHLVTQGGAPGWNLYYWNWERSQPLGSVSVAQLYHATQQAPAEGAGRLNAQQQQQQQEQPQSLSNGGSGADPLSADAGPPRTRSASSREAAMVVSSIGVCPHDPLLVSVAGNGFFRFYRYTDGLLQPQPSTGIPREPYEVFSTHLWITSHNVIAATRSGSLHLIQDGRYITTMELPVSAGLRFAGRSAAAASGDSPVPSIGAGGTDVVTCIAPTHPPGQRRSGFIAATSRGNLFVFEESQTAGGAVRRGGNSNNNNNNASAMAATAAGVGDDEDLQDALNYRLVCRLEVPVYEAGEQQLLQAQQARSRSQTVVTDSQAQASQRPTSGETALTGSRPSVNGRSESNSKGTVSATGKGRVGKLFELRHESQAKKELAVAGNGTGTAKAAGTGKKGSVPAERGSGSGSGGGGGGEGPFGGLGGSGSANDENSPEAEAQRRRRRIAAIALDQAEERLAVLTAAGKLYGLNFQQNWQKKEEMFATAALSTMSNNTSSAGGVGALALRSSDLAAGEAGGLVPSFVPGAGTLRSQQHQQPSLQQQQPRASLFEPLYPFSHSGRVNGMDCSVRKPLLITSGSDHSVRVWNTQSGQLIMCQFFPLEPGAVAIHPDGLVAVVCFPDKVRVMSVLSSSLRERRTINLRNATDVQFALGGQLFAIVHNNLVDVLNTNTCELHGQLRGHPQRIKDFQWCSTTPYPTDNRAVTCSADGMIMDWNIAEMRKQTEHTDKRFQYVAVASDDRSVWAVAAPTSATAMDVSWKVLLREIDRQSLGTTGSGAATAGANAGGGAGGTAAGGAGNFAGGLQGNSVGDYEFTETVLTSLAVAPHQRVLVAGAEDGSVKAITFPLQAGIQEAPLTAHALPVTRMAISFDETTLFTAAADGSVMMWEVYPEREKTKAAAAAAAGTATSTTAGAGISGGAAAGLLGAGASSQHQDPASRAVLSGGEEVLVTRQEMEEHSIEIESLQHYIEKLKTDMESEDKRRAHEQGTRTREKAEELQQVAVTLAAEYDALHHAKVDQERTFLDVKTEKEREAAERLEDLEMQRQREVDELEEECATLQHTLETTKTAHVEELRELQTQLATARKEDEAHYQDVLAQRTEAVRKLRRQLEQSEETNRVTLRQLELDTDAESQSVQQRQQHALQGVRERYLHLKGEGAVMRKNATRLEREIEVRTNELQLLDGAKVALQAQLAALTHQVAQLHQDIDERDSVTEKKEKIIYSLKKQNQELEKHKYVLDHQIRELKGQIEPKQREIAELNQETKNQNANLEEQHTNNMTLRENTEELKKDIAEQQTTLQARLRELKRLQTYRSRAERDLGELAHKLQDPAALAAAISQLYEVHVAPQDVEQIAPADPQVKHELQSQLEYLSTSVDALRRKLKADQQRHKKEVSAMMSENLSLIREIHSLRAEMDHLRARVAADTVVKQKQQHQQQLRRNPGGRGAGRGNAESRSTTRRASAERGAADTSQSGETAGASGIGVSGGSSRAVGGYPQSEVESNATGATGATRRRNGGGANTAAQRPPTPPAEIELNTNALRALRAYIEALERTLSEHAASAAASTASVRLPPVDPFGQN